jgi:hypothetical protein
VPPDEAEPVIEAVRHVILAPSCRFRPLWFDSPEERAVSEWVLALVEGEGLPWSLVPQIELASIPAHVPVSARCRTNRPSDGRLGSRWEQDSEVIEPKKPMSRPASALPLEEFNKHAAAAVRAEGGMRSVLFEDAKPKRSLVEG